MLKRFISVVVIPAMFVGAAPSGFAHAQAPAAAKVPRAPDGKQARLRKPCELKLGIPSADEYQIDEPA